MTKGHPEPARTTPRPLNVIFAPSNSQETLHRLKTGNKREWRVPGQVDPTGTPNYPLDEFGLPVQMPIAVMIGCSDARVPPEILFDLGLNDLFIIRAAGNVMGPEAAGSLLYAVQNFAPPNDLVGRSLRAVVVVGHRGCGAVKAAVQTYQKGIALATATGGPIDSVLARIAGPLEVGVRAFDRVHGIGAAYGAENLPVLLDLVIHLNSAQVARLSAEWIERELPAAAPHVAVVYGVLDPFHRHLHGRPSTAEQPEPETFAVPPRSDGELEALAEELVGMLTQPR